MLSIQGRFFQRVSSALDPRTEDASVVGAIPPHRTNNPPTATAPSHPAHPKRYSSKVNGLLVLDKPSGITSHDVIHRLRRLTGERSIGHLGTLDPLATGVLPVLLGRFTRLAQFFAAAEKTYTGSIRFGFATDTWDADGQTTTAAQPVHFSLDQLLAAAAPLRGDILQMPPIYSAKKISGTPAHQLARQGKPVELQPVPIHVSRFEIDSFADSLATFTISISAGGYIRSLAHDLGQRLGCGAHLASLRRTHAGAFTLHHAHTLASLESLAASSDGAAAIAQLCLHPRTILPEFPAVTADEVTLGRLCNGAQVNLPEFSLASLVKVFSGPNDLVAIARRIAGTLFQPIVVLG